METRIYSAPADKGLNYLKIHLNSDLLKEDQFGSLLLSAMCPAKQIIY